MSPIAASSSLSVATLCPAPLAPLELAVATVALAVAVAVAVPDRVDEEKPLCTAPVALSLELDLVATWTLELVLPYTLAFVQYSVLSCCADPTPRSLGQLL